MDQTIGKILIVDDEVELKNVLVEALTAQGYEAVGFTRGALALAALQEESFDILLTDLMHHDDWPRHNSNGRRRDESRGVRLCA